MKKTVFLLAIGLFVLSNAKAQTKNFIDKAYLETTARYDSTVVPDRIFLTILITEADTKGKSSVEELENKMAQKLKSLGIDLKKQLMLEDLASNFQKYFLRKKEVLKTKSYSLLVYDAKTAGEVILGLESINISNVRFAKAEYSKMEELKLTLRERVVEKAKVQAEALLKPLEQQVGKALYISDLNTSFPRQYSNRAVLGAMEMDSAHQGFEPIDIDFEKIKVESTVTVYFEIL